MFSCEQSLAFAEALICASPRRASRPRGKPWRPYDTVCITRKVFCSAERSLPVPSCNCSAVRDRRNMWRDVQRRCQIREYRLPEAPRRAVMYMIAGGGRREPGAKVLVQQWLSEKPVLRYSIVHPHRIVDPRPSAALRSTAFPRRIVYPHHCADHDPNVLIDVLPDQRIVYICIPKCASARIKKTLSALLGRHVESSEEAYTRQQSGLKNPKAVGASTFWRVATDPAALRFSFVRNPYARLVSLWAHQFRDKPLVPGLSSINKYLAWRR